MGLEGEPVVRHQKPAGAHPEQAVVRHRETGDVHAGQAVGDAEVVEAKERTGELGLGGRGARQNERHRRCEAPTCPPTCPVSAHAQPPWLVPPGRESPLGRSAGRMRRPGAKAPAVRTMPRARIVTIDGGTHDLIVEFEQTIDEVDRFLASIR